ncbi:PREDICTED: uncharacterized protein LOC106338931 [Brassica oleracea var. oleracea]|uniref:uncharacterized protein LOC106338931 n=1 Tax=Brassica oleracea var. oleracea TaxID=109376 RepID=UPI0006A6AE96|nr:PREDICTED: uncharacterized protein LOC106338931 [Brassica oleracea var. oleracea]
MTTFPAAEEITSTLFKLNQNNAPGLDGLTAGFYRGSWSVLGVEVIQSICHFFNTSFLPASTNATILSLVPKFPGESLITEYRPISCLNTLYKVISRLLVKRLKPILTPLIVPNQTTFVKGHLLVENTFLAGYNGYVNGYCKGTCGLRQGDPLSPYLFVIAMNTLSLMLNQAAQEMRINYHSKCQGSKLTHLCFADDLLIFMDGSLESVQSVLQVLREFELRSGLAVSVQKSSFFASGLSQRETDLIQFTTGMPMGSLPVRYLGVPLCTKKLSLLHCEVLLQQIKTKLSSWSAKSLSFAGRLLLIKTVITGITTFWCSTFILPQACVKRINSLCGVFLWQGDIEKHHTARVSWVVVTKPKREGELGIKNLAIWNKACCLKLIWLLFFQSGLVWVAWFVEEVLNGSVNNLWTTAPSQRYSWQNGLSCRFWSDNWSPYGSLRSYLSLGGNSSLGIHQQATIASLRSNNNWLLPPARSDNLVNIHAYLTTIHLNDNEDYYEWEIDGKISSRYSAGTIYEKLCVEGVYVPWFAMVWNKGGIPRHNQGRIQNDFLPGAQYHL